jgi:AraC-like DNA-binding protein
MAFTDLALRVSGVLILFQGLALGCLVGSRWRNEGNLSLAALLSLLGIHGLAILAWNGEAPPAIRSLVAILGSEIALYGPLMWRYSLAALAAGKKRRMPFAIHFLPAVALTAAYAISYFVLGPAEFDLLVSEVFKGGGPLWVRCLESAKLAQGLAYAVAVVVLWYRNRSGLRRWADRRSRVRWLRALAITYAGNWIIALGGNALRWILPAGPAFALGSLLPQAAAILAFLYALGFFALRFPSVLDPRDARDAIRRALRLPEGFAEETLRRLERARAQGAFADPELDLPRLAAALGLHANELSFVVNDSLGVGFREYLNSARLEAFLERRKTGSGRSILDDALDCGFASKTGFLRAFRAAYGTTPTEYLKRLPG